MADKKIILQDVTLEGVEYLRLVSVSISHTANEPAHASIKLLVDEKKGKKFFEQANADKIKISADKKVIFQGCISNMSFQKDLEHSYLQIDLLDVSCMLDWKIESQTFQNLSAKYEELFKTIKDAKIQLKVTDKPIKNVIVRLNETGWQFIKRLASHFSAMIFTDLTAEKPLLTIGLPEPKKSWELPTTEVKYYFDDEKFQYLNANAKKLAEGVKIIAEDFKTIHLESNYEILNVGDEVKFDKKSYRVKSFRINFADEFLRASYEIVGKSAFVVPIEEQKNISGRVFRAQVKKVEKDKVQAHFVDIDKSFDSKSTMMYPFATSYSSADGSGWYAMPEVDDYVRILFPSIDTANAFAMSSINTAPLKEPKNKSLKAPGGREILLTEKSVEIIADHQKTFILIDKDKGVNIVSAKDIILNADGNINFDAKGKIQIVSGKEIDAQSGQSHVKILSNQIGMGGSNIIVGE